MVRAIPVWLIFDVSGACLSVMPIILPSYFRGFLLKKSFVYCLLVIMRTLICMVGNGGIDKFN